MKPINLLRMGALQPTAAGPWRELNYRVLERFTRGQVQEFADTPSSSPKSGHMHMHTYIYTCEVLIWACGNAVYFKCNLL